MEKSKTMKILEILIGEKEFNNLIHDIIEEYKDTELLLGDMEPLLEAYAIVILIIGFSKKQVELEKYQVELSNKTKIIIEMNDFYSSYKSYIQKIEDCKFDLLRKII